MHWSLRHLDLGRLLLPAVLAIACAAAAETSPPPGGWANNAPTRVVQVVDRDEHQLLRVAQGQFETWVHVPAIGARAGDYVLLGQGTARRKVVIPEIDATVDVVVDIDHALAVDLETTRAALDARSPEQTLGVGTVYAELAERADSEIFVEGIVTKVAGAIGWYWVHLRDASGAPELAELDLTVQTHDKVSEGQRVVYRGVLRKDVDLGFGYFYDAMLREAEQVR